MDEIDATKLTGRILDTWNSPAKPYVWVEALRAMDPDRSQATYLDLRREWGTGWLTVHDFTDAYRRHRAPGGEPNDCHRCDNGWTDAPPIAYATRTKPDHTAPAVKPCQCPAGEFRRRQLTRWDEQENRRTEETM